MMRAQQTGPDERILHRTIAIIETLGRRNTSTLRGLHSRIRSSGRCSRRGSDQNEKATLVNAAIGVMDRVMKLGVALTYLPASAGHPGVNAGLTFSAPRALPPLIASPSEWKILSYGIQGVARGVADLRGVPDAAGLAKGLAAIAASFP